MMTNTTKTAELFKNAFTTLDTTEISLPDIKELLKATFDTTKLYELHGSVNNLLKIAQEKKRYQTVRNVLEGLAELEGIITYDLVQLNIPESVNFLVQTSNTKSVCHIIQKMLKRNMVPSDRAINATIDYALKEKLCDEAMIIVRLLLKTNKWNAMYIREVARNLLIYGQIKLVCEILESLTLDVPGVNYVWDNFIEYCCNKDHVKICRELIDKIASRILPKHTVEVTNIYNVFLEKMMGSKFTLPTIKTTMEDVARLRLKIKGSIVKDGLVKIIEENPDPRAFVHKILIFRYNIDAYTYGNMITRLVQLNKKCEVLTLVDLVLGENGFGFSFNELNLNPNDLKYIVKYQSISIKIMKDEWKKGDFLSPTKLAQPPCQSETMSILDQLSLEDFEPLKKEDFEFLESLPRDEISST